MAIARSETKIYFPSVNKDAQEGRPPYILLDCDWLGYEGKRGLMGRKPAWLPCYYPTCGSTLSKTVKMPAAFEDHPLICLLPCIYIKQKYENLVTICMSSFLVCSID